MEPKTLSIFEEKNRGLSHEYDKNYGWTCECYGHECDCDRSCDASDPCQDCVSGQ